MEGSHPHNDFVQEEIGYDDLINNNSWPSHTDQYTYQQQAPSHLTYPAEQQTYSHFDLPQQQSYSQVPYSNSQYQSQYNHARPSDVFGPTSYNLDPSLQTSTQYHAPQSSFPFNTPTTETSTIAPHSLQYNMALQQPMNNVVSNSSFQQPLGRTGNKPDYNFSNQTPQETSSMYYSNPQVLIQANGGNLVHFPRNGEPEVPPKTMRKPEVDSSISRAPQYQPAPVQNPLRITHPEPKNGSSQPRFEHAPYLTWQDTPIQIAAGVKNTIPKFHPRKSKSGRELIPGFDLSRASTKPERVSKKVRAPKDTKILVSKYQGTSQGPKSAINRVLEVRGDEAARGSTTPTETSSSEDESSSEEESDYGDEEEMPPPIDISMVRDVTRPTDVAAAARWDAIGIVWKDPNSRPSADVVKVAIEEFGNFVSALRTQLKTNSTQIEEATKAKPLDTAKVDALRRAHTANLEVLYQVIDAANSLGYGDIVEHLGNHHKLVNALTSTLMGCIKADDFLGKLPKAIFSLLAKFQSMTDELLKKLKFDAITKRWNKKGDEETKKDITSILSNTVEAKERYAKAQKEAVKMEEGKKYLEQLEQAKARSSEPLKSTTNAIKRPHEGDGSNGKPNKKFASDVSSAIPSSSKAAPVRRPINVLANNLLGNSFKSAPSKPVKKREHSPPTESKLGALLASISKPPEPPKAPEAPPRAPETPEEKKRRERKESRRHLRVKFKEGPELEEIRLFKHEQAEDEGRQDDMLRDAHDDRSEGMMHKQRVQENLYGNLEDDEFSGDRPYPNIVEVDFSTMEQPGIFGSNNITRGGTTKFTTPEQKNQQRREALELMVIYTDPKDIPPSPKEPPPSADLGTQQEKLLPQSDKPWLKQRLAEIENYGTHWALKSSNDRISERKHKERQENYVRGIHPLTSSSPNTSSIFQQLGTSQPNQQINQTTNMPEERIAAAWANLAAIVESSKLKGKLYPPTQPPDYMTGTIRASWIEGYDRDNAGKSLHAPAAPPSAPMTPAQDPPQLPTPQMQSQAPEVPQTSIGFNSPQAPDTAQQLQNYLAAYGQNVGHNPSAGSDANQQLQNYLAALGQPVGNNVSAESDAAQQLQNYLSAYGHTTGNTPHEKFDYNQWVSSNTRGQDQSYGEQDQNQKSSRDGNWNENSHQKSNQPWDNSKSNNKRKHDTWEDGPLDANGEYKGKKKPCRFWREGKCAKGSKCTFLHD